MDHEVSSLTVGHRHYSQSCMNTKYSYLKPIGVLLSLVLGVDSLSHVLIKSVLNTQGKFSTLLEFFGGCFFLSVVFPVSNSYLGLAVHSALSLQQRKDTGVWLHVFWNIPVNHLSLNMFVHGLILFLIFREH